jgi:serine/threonine-protein kinase
MAEVTPDPLIGKVLNERFKIIEPLGVGGMGRVYKAIQSPLDRVIALKVLNPKYAGSKDPGFERRFFLEAAMTAKLHHPNTITVHDYGRTEDGVYFIAMEYVEGETLQARLARDGTLAWQRALHIAGQIARSLREAHKLGMIHRDLKPANVMLLQEETDSDLVKVLDFGLVKSLIGEGPLSPTDTELTQAGVLLGSPLYMAPEQARNEADARSDIYALGVLLYQCICGKPPFTGKESIDIIVKHIREKPVQLKNHVIDLPVEVNALVMKCLEKEPANRFQSMDELLESLRLAAANAGLSGAFSDPRSMVYRTSSSQQIKAVSPSMLVTPDSTRADRVGSVSDSRATADESVEVPWEDSQAVQKKRGQRVALIALGSAVGLAAVVGVLLFIRKPPPPIPAPAPIAPPPAVVVKKDPPPKPIEPKPAPMLVSFVVMTTPAGASVTRDGLVLGVTPMSFTVAPGENGSASAELTFALDGYQPVTVTAQGTGPEVTVKQTLPRLKKQPTVIKKTNRPTGYKDDPYQ